MTSLGIGLIIGVPVGWIIHTMYLRSLYKTMVSIRRQMRGGGKRKRRRLWASSEAVTSIGGLMRVAKITNGVADAVCCVSMIRLRLRKKVADAGYGVTGGGSIGA